MEQDNQQRLDLEIERRFHYVEYPNGVTSFIWKDGRGESVFMESMSVEHLKFSIGKVRKDKAAFQRKYKGALNEDEMMSALIPLVDKKLNELQAVLNKKTSN